MRSSNDDVREEAIEWCLAAADACISDKKWWTFDALFGAAPPTIAMDAWTAANAIFDGCKGDPGGEMTYLNAAGLLLDGWNPGDPVGVRNAE